MKVTYKYYGDIKDRKSRMRTPRTICQILITQEGKKKRILATGKKVFTEEELAKTSAAKVSLMCR